MLNFTLSFSPWALHALLHLIRVGESEEITGFAELASGGFVQGEKRAVSVPIKAGSPGQRGEAIRMVFTITPAGLKLAELLAMFSTLGEPYASYEAAIKAIKP